MDHWKFLQTVLICWVRISPGGTATTPANIKCRSWIMPTILNTTSNFSSLSVKDLLMARDLYHYHLINKANVVGTAIGLYLIRDTDPVPDTISHNGATKKA